MKRRVPEREKRIIIIAAIAGAIGFLFAILDSIFQIIPRSGM
jgi:hypothetical protein